MKEGQGKRTIISKGFSVMVSESYSSGDEDLIYSLLNENDAAAENFNFSVLREVRNFLAFTGTMLTAFPVGLLMRKKLRKDPRLNHILQFKELLPVRNNIEKGSFAYDTILFRESALQLPGNKSHLANLVCLAILFGDEFIDGLATEYGKRKINAILSEQGTDHYLHFRKKGQSEELYYLFDICTVLPQCVLEAINPRFGISYMSFYNHLQFLLSEMNKYLGKLPAGIAAEAAALICKACNKCFDTYKTEIAGFDPSYDLSALMRYQKSKDDDIIQVLLTLRAVLLQKRQLAYQRQFSSWSSMVRSMQLYDDMQDVAVDCDFQMNIVCFFARKYFTAEWNWLLANRNRLKGIQGIELHASVSLFMPASCMLTQQYARNIACTNLGWVQRKIQNYLWRKNWHGHKNKLLKKQQFDLSVVLGKTAMSNPFKLYFIQKLILSTEGPFITEDMKQSYIIDIAIFDDNLRPYIMKQMTRKERYFLGSCFLEFPLKEKASLAKRLIA